MYRRPKILIVDDWQENLTMLSILLQELDVELVEALNAEEALETTKEHDFALALLDIQLPGMNGYELATALREQDKTAHLPFIFISTVYTKNIDLFKGYENGAFSFLTKPIQPDLLISKVQFFIDKYLQEYDLVVANHALVQKNLELETMNKELESFSYSISHDLRAPLRSINGFAEVLKTEYAEKLDGHGTHLLTRIMENGLRMNKLIDSLLNLSRLGRKELLLREVDMNFLLKGLSEELKADFESPRILWKVNKVPPAIGDRELLRQVFVNLISNAVKYSSLEQMAEIEIGGEQGEKENVYFIKDNGVGFDMKYENKLFGVFQRLHGAHEFEGTGIGLAIVKRIINRHGGRIWADAKLDEGATFYFSLPPYIPS